MADPKTAELERDGGPAQLPAALSQEWPVAWQPVWGSKDGPWRVFLSVCVEAMIFVTVRLPRPLLRLFIELMARTLRRAMPRRSRVATA